MANIENSKYFHFFFVQRRHIKIYEKYMAMFQFEQKFKKCAFFDVSESY